MLFLCGKGMYVWGKLHGGKQICLAQQASSTDWAPSPSKQCKNGKVAAQDSVFVDKKTEKLDINPSVQSWAVPKRLVCVRWTFVL